VDSLQIRQLVVICVDTCAEEEAGVPAVYDLGHIAEFDEVGLVFLVARGYEAVDLCTWSIGVFERFVADCNDVRNNGLGREGEEDGIPRP